MLCCRHLFHRNDLETKPCLEKMHPSPFLLLSAVVLWSFVLASLLYAARRFPAPFRDTLTPEQVRIKKESAKARGSFFWCAFIFSLLVVSVVAWGILRSRRPVSTPGSLNAAL